VITLQRQLSLVASENEDKDVIGNGGSAVTGNASPGSQELRRRALTSHGSNKSIDKKTAAAEKKPLMSNELIKEEVVEEGAVCL